MTTEEALLQEPIDYSDLEAKYAVEKDTSFSNILIIDHLPQVDQAKEEKLLAVLAKNVFGKENRPVPGGLFMPRDEEKDLSKGYLFAEFETPEMAEAVLRNAQGFKLDKTHVLSVIRFADFEGIEDTPEVFVEPKVEPFEEKEYLKSWLSDEQARDQFLVYQANNLNVYWGNKRGSPQLVTGRTNWTDNGAQWSTRGSYLITLHQQGVALWGGETFKKITRFPHPNVTGVRVSKGEKYLVSVGEYVGEEEANVQVWDISTSKLVRGFSSPDLNVKFSSDDSYFARILDSDNLGIHELPSGQLLEKKPYGAAGVQDFEWSPTDNMLLYWTRGTENTPTRVALLQVPSRLILRSKNLFNVEACRVHWQSEGDYVAVTVDRHVKGKSAVFTSAELFRVRQKNVPVDVVDFGQEHTVGGFYWQTGGEKFIAQQDVEFKSIMTLFAVNHVENGMEVVKELKREERKQISTVKWSPKGDFLVMAGMATSTAVLEFWQAQGTDLVMLGSREHVYSTELEWEPAGRCLASWTDVKRFSSDNNVQMWDVKGDLLFKLALPRISRFMWRPRPATLISKDVIKGIRKNLKTLSAEYEAEDAKADAKETLSAGDLRRRLLEEWEAFRASAGEAYHARRELRMMLTGAKELAGSEEMVMVEELVEQVIEETEEVISQ